MTPVCEENIRKVVAGGGVAALGTGQSSGAAGHRELELLVQAGRRSGVTPGRLADWVGASRFGPTANV